MSSTPSAAVITNVERSFPVLTAAQMQRVAAFGRVRPINVGEVLYDQGDTGTSFFVVKHGRLQTTRPLVATETFIVHVEPGHFTGETNLLSGRPAVARVRVIEPGEVIELTREQLLNLIQADAELSQILMLAFLLRHVMLVEQGLGDVVLLGSRHSPDTLRIREFLTRNSHPHTYIDLERDADVQTLLDRFQISVNDVPVLICRGTTVLRNPTNREIADCLNLNEDIDEVHLRDVVVIGAGPSGLATAVYGASEGLDVLVLEADAPGGQAASSSRIENYLGFPTGISGGELTGRAYAQAQKFGAQLMVARTALQLACDRQPYAIESEDGAKIPARSVVIATGAEYRKLPLPNLARYQGIGVYYAATAVEAPLCEAEEVIVVGGGNSAGQAAVFLSQTARRVYILVRSSGLAATMSRYLIRRIEDSPNIELRVHTEIVGLEGDDHLERVVLRNNATGATETLALRHVFLMMGAVPNTKWLNGCVVLDANGFIKTGPDLTGQDLAAAKWPLPRSPFLLESSLPGVFAVGDVRSGSIKRVASAVGEGSIAISFVHQYLAG